MIATPLLSVLAGIATILVLSKSTPLRKRIDAAHVLFVIIGLAAMNLLLLSFDRHAFGDEFGLYLFGLLPFLLLMAIAGAWSVIAILRSTSFDLLLSAMSVITLAFIFVGMFGAFFGWFPPGFTIIVEAYFGVAVFLAVVWFVFRRGVFPT